jgi:DNA mismatch repair ATPase MutS
MNGNAESGEHKPLSKNNAGEMQMTLFEMKDDKLREELKKIDVEKITPLEALQKLAEIKKKIE